MVAQWLAWRLRLPSILLLLVFGFLVGPVSGIFGGEGTRWIDPDHLFDDLLFPIVSLFVSIILFEGGLSLKLAELRSVGRSILGLITVGVVITWGLTTGASYWLLDLDLRLSLLFGAILTVTGPTVIGPLLRHVRPSDRVASVLKWEGIVNDPIGAMLSVLVFEAILVDFESATTLVLVGLAKTVAIGTRWRTARGARPDHVSPAALDSRFSAQPARPRDGGLLLRRVQSLPARGGARRGYGYGHRAREPEHRQRQAHRRVQGEPRRAARLDSLHFARGASRPYGGDRGERGPRWIFSSR